MNFSNFAVYRLIPYFSKQPGYPTCCFHCGEYLSTAYIEPSRVIQEDVELQSYSSSCINFSLLHFCENCHWWIVRESWYCYKFPNANFDYIIVGVASNDSPCEAYEKPWLKPMADTTLYYNCLNVPENIAVLFPKRS